MTEAIRAAHALLDRARNGEDIPTDEICEALRVTGDLDPATVVQILTPIGRWEARSIRARPSPLWFTPIH